MYIKILSKEKGGHYKKAPLACLKNLLSFAKTDPER